ncbi:hypothetical protein MVES1_001776 [Malassezia vespertilionis]|uniref:Ysc84 actin-binding domain-containing protein n=1 Tax=Malassezia vespertilionis TaxID=2020962 RepID=A0A2N1JCZ9_9BASI|nr:uncharacterized protein MVES1_001776 [Malassezia vespertilionis]PKI84407.1 hypothetical protein MVES_001675 [Malassezia vespertilionis]WFD06431.1 hypothetical protein MVES1_001776 [Malassezia vespertilionis]
MAMEAEGGGIVTCLRTDHPVQPSPLFTTMPSSFDSFFNAAKRVSAQASMYAQAASADLQSGFSLPSECNRAARILRNFLTDPEHPETINSTIPKSVLMRAKGLAIFTIVKGGFVWSGKVGSGVVIARLPDGSWSTPTCIATGGIGIGWQVGADVTEFVVVMNTEEAVKSFGLSGNLTFGGSLSAAAGPIGIGGTGMFSVAHIAPMYSYSRSKGLYIGISLEGTALVERKDANREFYGQSIPAMDLLMGKVPAPEAAAVMYEVIEAAEDLDENEILHQLYPNARHDEARKASTYAGESPADDSYVSTEQEADKDAYPAKKEKPTDEKPAELQTSHEEAAEKDSPAK